MLPLQDLLERWMAGEPVAGVEYHLNDLVEPQERLAMRYPRLNPRPIQLHGCSRLRV
jgi:hypothetical protein